MTKLLWSKQTDVSNLVYPSNPAYACVFNA